MTKLWNFLLKFFVFLLFILCVPWNGHCYEIEQRVCPKNPTGEKTPPAAASKTTTKEPPKIVETTTTKAPIKNAETTNAPAKVVKNPVVTIPPTQGPPVHVSSTYKSVTSKPQPPEVKNDTKTPQGKAEHESSKAPPLPNTKNSSTVTAQTPIVTGGKVPMTTQKPDNVDGTFSSQQNNAKAGTTHFPLYTKDEHKHSKNPEFSASKTPILTTPHPQEIAQNTWKFSTTPAPIKEKSATEPSVNEVTRPPEGYQSTPGPQPSNAKVASQDPKQSALHASTNSPPIKNEDSEKVSNPTMRQTTPSPKDSESLTPHSSVTTKSETTDNPLDKKHTLTPQSKDAMEHVSSSKPSGEVSKNTEIPTKPDKRVTTPSPNVEEGLTKPPSDLGGASNTPGQVTSILSSEKDTTEPGNPFIRKLEEPKNASDPPNYTKEEDTTTRKSKVNQGLQDKLDGKKPTRKPKFTTVESKLNTTTKSAATDPIVKVTTPKPDNQYNTGSSKSPTDSKSTTAKLSDASTTTQPRKTTDNSKLGSTLPPAYQTTTPKPPSSYNTTVTPNPMNSPTPAKPTPTPLTTTSIRPTTPKPPDEPTTTMLPMPNTTTPLTSAYRFPPLVKWKPPHGWRMVQKPYGGEYMFMRADERRDPLHIPENQIWPYYPGDAYGYHRHRREVEEMMENFTAPMNLGRGMPPPKNAGIMSIKDGERIRLMLRAASKCVEPPKNKTEPVQMITNACSVTKKNAYQVFIARSPPWAPKGWWQFASLHSSLCLEHVGEGGMDGNAVWQKKCQDNNIRQLWTAQAGNKGLMSLKEYDSCMCVSTNNQSQKNEAPLEVTTCDPKRKDFIWRVLVSQ